MGILERVYASAPHSVRALALNAYAQYLHFRREGPGMARAFDSLESIDRSSMAQIRRYQVGKLNELIDWARSRVPYYRSRLEGQFVLESVEDLSRLPLLDKPTVRSRKQDLIASGMRLYDGHTSGTTGSPLQLVYDSEQLVWNRAAEKLVRARSGLSLDDRVAVIWGRHIVPPKKTKPPFWTVNYPDRELWMSAFHISAATIRYYLRAIEEFGAVALECYPSVAYLLAQLAKTDNAKLSLKRVLTTSESLFPFQRETIQEVFQAEVYDYYACAERVVFAIECSRHQGLHLLEGFGYVEQGGQESGIVATGLTNKAMPLLRYALSDVTTVISEPCTCGLNSRRLTPITTKREDMIQLPDGRYISPSALTAPFKPLKHLVRSQIVQESLERVVVYLQVDRGFDSKEEQSLHTELRKRLGGEIDVELRRVAELQPERSGKFRWVISKVRGIHQVGQR